jgi:nucleoid DNA-binding protein
MNSLELINKLAESNNLSTGRAEMIISIIVERISEKLKTNGQIEVENFGKFVLDNTTSSSSYRKKIKFIPSKSFLEKINTG